MIAQKTISRICSVLCAIIFTLAIAPFQAANGVALYGGFAGTQTRRAHTDHATNSASLTGDLNHNVAGFHTNSENVDHAATGANGVIRYDDFEPKVDVVDPNLSMQGIQIPVEPEVQAAIDAAVAKSAAVNSAFSFTFQAAGTTDPWGAACQDFPAEAQTAFIAAAAIWAATIQSPVPITISACWSDLGSTTVPGYWSTRFVYGNFSGALKSDTLYKPALANALHGSDLDPSSYDDYITYNSGFSWYYGTDGAVPAGQYDLVTIAAHDIAQGLNFSGSAAYTSGTGSYGYGPGYPDIYDTFMEDGSWTKLTSYTNPSTELGSLLTSGSLWFDGSNANAANGALRVKMYAPSSWLAGASYNNLDYDTFAGTADSMLVYKIASGSSQHNPGPVTRGLLKDLGWALAGDTFALNVSKTGTGSGTVTSSPEGINCGSVCSASFDYYTSVTLTTIASTGSTFSGWSGSGCAGTGDCTVTMNVAKSVSADFAANDKGTWNAVTSPVAYPLTSVAMLSASDGWAVGYEGYNPNGTLAGSVILRWNAGIWNEWGSDFSSDPLWSVTTVSDSNGWISGNLGVIKRWNGTAWNSVQNPIGATDLFSVAMVSPENGWAVGGDDLMCFGSGTINGAILRWDGSAWTGLQLTDISLRSVAMLSATDGWAVGYKCHHYFFEPGHIPMAYNASFIMHWNGTNWNEVSSPNSINTLNSISMLSATNGWAVGWANYDSSILHWNGSTWSLVNSPSYCNLKSVAMVSANEGWIVGRQLYTSSCSQTSVILYWNGNIWSEVISPVSSGLNSVTMISANEGWAVGDAGTILHYTNMSNLDHRIYLPLAIRQ